MGSWSHIVARLVARPQTFFVEYVDVDFYSVDGHSFTGCYHADYCDFVLMIAILLIAILLIAILLIAIQRLL